MLISSNVHCALFTYSINISLSHILFSHIQFTLPSQHITLRPSVPQHSIVYLDVSFDGKSVGRLVFELFDELLPRTCHNFRQLCSGRSGVSDQTGTMLWYAGTPVHRIVRGGWLQAGGRCRSLSGGWTDVGVDVG